MAIKTIIVILLVANVAALGRAFYTLMVDQGQGGKRTVNWLSIRVILAGLLILALGFGVWNGDIAVSSPWYK